MSLPPDPQPVPRRPARPRGRGRPTPDEASRLSAHLIEVAATLFEQEGFSAVSMNRIAATAGIGKDTLYARYPNKEALFLAVFSRQTEQHLGNCPSLAGTDTPCETALRRYGEWLLRSACTPGGLSRWLIFYRESQRFPGLARVFEAAYGRMFLAPLGEFFAARQARGDYPGIRPERLARLFCDTVLSGLLNRLLLDGALPVRAERTRHLAAISQVFARGALP